MYNKAYFFIKIQQYTLFCGILGGILMNSIGSRIKEVRKDNKLTQEQFGQKIGLKDSAVSMLERNDRSLTESVAKNIMTQFNVNELWLKRGEGDKYNQELIRQKEFLESISSGVAFTNRNIDRFIEKIKLLEAAEQEELLDIMDKLWMIFYKEPETNAYKYINIMKNELVKYLKEYMPDIEANELMAETAITDNTLKDDEKELLILYRNLSNKDKEEVMSFIEFKNSNKEALKKKQKLSTSAHNEEAATFFSKLG
jgi:transcriptional regulator with XRE-family HTH domain